MFGNKVFKELSKLKRSLQGGPYSNITGVLTRTENLGTYRHQTHVETEVWPCEAPARRQ